MPSSNSDRIALIAAAAAIVANIAFHLAPSSRPYVDDVCNGQKWTLGVIGLTLASAIVGGWLVRQVRSLVAATVVAEIAAVLLVPVYVAMVGYGAIIGPSVCILQRVWWIIVPFAAVTAWALRFCQRWDAAAPTDLERWNRRWPLTSRLHDPLVLASAFLVAFLTAGGYVGWHVYRACVELDDCLVSSAQYSDSNADAAALRRSITPLHRIRWSDGRFVVSWEIMATMAGCSAAASQDAIALDRTDWSDWW